MVQGSVKNRSIYLLLTLGPGTVPGDTAIIAIVEWPSWRVIDTYEYKHVVYEKTHKGFAGGCIIENKLLATTEAEILQFSLAPLKLKKTTTKKYLNDVHYVAPADGGYVVVNTGLDTLELFDYQWNHKSAISVVQPFKKSFSYLVDLAIRSYKKQQTRKNGNRLYSHLNHRVWGPNIKKFFSPLGIRKLGEDLRYYDFRPHFLHPNHLTTHGNDYWVTLFGPGIVLRVPDGRVLASGLGRPHDGIVVGNEFFITDCADSRLFIYDMNEEIPGNRRLMTKVIPPEGKGLLRGLTVIDDNIFVGLSALRGESNFPNGRIARLDRQSGQIKDSWKIPEKFGNSIFSILNVSEFYA